MKNARDIKGALHFIRAIIYVFEVAGTPSAFENDGLKEDYFPNYRKRVLQSQ